MTTFKSQIYIFCKSEANAKRFATPNPDIISLLKDLFQ